MANQYTPFRFYSDSEKECSDCGEIKPHSAFNKDKQNKRCGGLAYYCKECASRRTRSHHAKHKHSEEYKRSKRNTSVKRLYKLTLDEYETKLKLQNCKCAICNIELPLEGNMTHLDHCHTTNKVRDFLCTNCNRGLGHFQDSVTLLENAISYLNKHNNNDVIVEQDVVNARTS